MFSPPWICRDGESHLDVVPAPTGWHHCGYRWRSEGGGCCLPATCGGAPCTGTFLARTFSFATAVCLCSPDVSLSPVSGGAHELSKRWASAPPRIDKG